MTLEEQYLNIIKEILEKGVFREDRTGVGCYSVFGRTITHDYKNGFPLLTTKKIFTKGVLVELLWFLMGTEDPSFMLESNVHIWDEWIKDGKLPHTYGVKWRNFYGTDQIANLIDQINKNPESRRLVVSAWDAANVNNAALPWCHVLWQIDIEKYKEPIDGKKGDMSILAVQRSADAFLGVPFNLASYSFLLYMIAEVTGYNPKSMHYTFGNCHIYANHMEQCREQLSRKPYDLPTVSLVHKDNIDDFVLEDFMVHNYVHYPAIKAKVAV